MEIGESTELSPMVLLVDIEDEGRAAHAAYLQTAGFGVTTAADPDAAMTRATDLRPSVIVAGLTLDGRIDGFRFIRAVSEDADTRDTPLVILSGGPIEGLPRGAQEHAAAVLVKPVSPDALGREIHRVLGASQELRERSTRLTTKAQSLRERSNFLLARTEARQDRQDDRRRNCPDCGGLLEWLERGAIGGVEYDYYRWCANACGLYCYDRGSKRFVKLA